MYRYWRRVLPLAAVVLLSASPGQAGRWNRVLDIGDAAPPFRDLDGHDLVGIDDREHSLADFKDATAIVVVFTANSCPYATALEGRIIELQDDYRDKGVQVVAICVSTFEEDNLQAMKQHASEAKFNFAYLFDPTQKTGREYGASCTPHFFLLDRERKIAYMGAMDNGDLARAPTQHYLRDAIDAVLAGSEVPRTESKQRGCNIQY